MEKITMTFRKSTKGTHVYEDTDTDTLIKTIYLSKEPLEKAFGGTVPVGIVVTVEEVK